MINHVDLVPGTFAYHRAMLIDVFIRHFWDWWLVGTNDAKNWGWDMWDTSNQFVNEGESGGLATFICFILLISWSFGMLGKARKLVEAEGDRKKEWSLWFLGVALFAHIVAFFGISYFDQTKFMWYSVFAIIIAITVPILATKTVTEELPAFDLPKPRPRRATPAAPGLARVRRTN